MIATLHTDFVSLCMSAVSDDANALQRSLVVRSVDYHATLPPGMTVDATACVDVSVRADKNVRDFAFDFRFLDVAGKGSRESGECLDAQSFDHNAGTLMLGTEDGESLSERYKWFDLRYDVNYPISYLDDGFRVSFAHIPTKAVLDFHFIVAYARIDRGDSATWFAVDVPQREVRNIPTIRVIQLS